MQTRLKPTSVVVTHDMNSAFYVADRMALLLDGNFVMVGTKEEFERTANKEVRRFITGGAEDMEGGGKLHE